MTDGSSWTSLAARHVSEKSCSDIRRWDGSFQRCFGRILWSSLSLSPRWARRRTLRMRVSYLRICVSNCAGSCVSSVSRMRGCGYVLGHARHGHASCVLLLYSLYSLSSLLTPLTGLSLSCSLLFTLYGHRTTASCKRHAAALSREPAATRERSGSSWLWLSTWKARA